MIKKTIRYEDYNGNSHNEDFYFHLGEDEVMLLQVEYANRGGFGAYMQDVIEHSVIRSGEFVNMFKLLIDQSYGVRSADGERFHKSPQALEEFKSSGAYGKLIVNLLTNPGEGETFFNGIMPEHIKAKAESLAKDPANKDALLKRMRLQTEARRQAAVKFEESATRNQAEADVEEITQEVEAVVAKPVESPEVSATQNRADAETVEERRARLLQELNDLS